MIWQLYVVSNGHNFSSLAWSIKKVIFSVKPEKTLSDGGILWLKMFKLVQDFSKIETFELKKDWSFKHTMHLKP